MFQVVSKLEHKFRLFQYFTVELYDENNFDFLYCGKFTRNRFEEIKRVQRLKFNMDQAPKIIVSFVQGLADDRKRFVNCSIVEPAPTTQVPGMGERPKNVCRFELMCRSEFKEMSELTLELDRVQGEQLNQHLIQFIDKYKVGSLFELIGLSNVIGKTVFRGRPRKCLLSVSK